jgi:hypothetical protein
MIPPRYPALAPAWRCAIVLNVALLVLLVCLGVVLGLRGLLWRADFGALYTGWSMIVEGQGGRLYDLDLQNDYQHRVLPEKPADEGVLPFVYPPHMAVTLAPLALLPRPAAFAVWTLLQVGLCVLACRFLLRLQADQPASVRWTTLLGFLAFPPLTLTILMGQLSLWCLVCLLGFVTALRERRSFAIAAWLVAGTVKPQLVVIPFVLLLGLRRWRELALATGLLVGWCGLATVVLGPGCWLAYPPLLHFSSRHFDTFGTDPTVMYNLKGLLTGILGIGRASLIFLLTVVAWLAGGLATLWLWRKRDAVEAPDFPGRLALTLLLATLVNPHVFGADVLVLVLPAVLFYRHLVGRGEWTQSVVFAGIALLCPVLFLVDCYLLPPLGLWVRPFYLLLLGLAGWMAVTVGRSAEPRTVPAEAGAGGWQLPPPHFAAAHASTRGTLTEPEGSR